MKKFFGTDGIRGRVGVAPITAEGILRLGWALGTVLIAKGIARPQVLIGKDTRVSGYLFESALEAGLSSAGADTILLGPMPTPAIAYLTRALRVNAGIVISASHNPYMDNGIKLFSRKGTKLSDTMEMAIEETMALPNTTVDSRALGKASRLRDAEGRYIEFCKNTFPANLDLRGLKIIVDCAHGATYRVAPLIFKELGAEVIEINVKPDGFNINEKCGSTHISGLAEQVLREQANIGIAFDGDGDRTILVDHLGNMVDGDEILFIVANWYQETNRLSGGVVGTVMSNLGLEMALKEKGIPFSRTAVGDRHIHEKLKQNAWNLGGEASGHILCLDAHTTGDGIVSALRVLAVMCAKHQSLLELKKGMVKYPQKLINIPVPEQKNFLEDTAIQSAVQIAERRLNGKGRVLLRASGTEPLIRVMVEGEDLESVGSVAEELASSVQVLI
jgi:phosphoglucosamine mutase